LLRRYDEALAAATELLELADQDPMPLWWRTCT
jgi:hypothetical protein